jgi:hypothetical protein
MMPRGATHMPVFCSDPAVQRFMEEEMIISPYAVAEFTKSARELFQAARDRFGDHRCLDLEFWEH